jgi:hypothetical protein
MRQRYEQVCAHALALPGTNLTADQVSACVSAYGARGCRDFNALSGCNVPGTLAGGASCATGTQCQSSSCSKSSSSADGGSVTPACGTCDALIPDGQPCGGTARGQCSSASRCETATTPPFCAAVIVGDVGSSCSQAPCKAGLFCNPTTMLCAFPGGAGAACTDTTGCTYPLSCLGTPPNQTCQSPQRAGAPCTIDSDCSSGLGCDPMARQCGAIGWASSGQPCGGLVRCLVGNCSASMTSGQCPVVIADNQPCTSSTGSATCDTFASCINGTCTLAASIVCN